MNSTSKTNANRSNQKKSAALKDALGCFVEFGVEGTTIDMLREATGMSVGSLYHHFGNKEKIAVAVFLEGMRQFGDLTRDYLEKIPIQDRCAEIGIKNIVYAQVDWISDNPKWAGFVFQHRSYLSKGSGEKRFSNDKNRFVMDFISWISPFMKQTDLTPLPFELYASLISGPTQDYARHWLSGRYKTPLKEHREILANAAWQAVKYTE